ncbi:hypothetical protein HHI31_02610 [Campylobacter fetus subsp. venerealis]|uniref:hypothetical protein n=1 Tax=Campylobacter fetus TaxID=196 RepID=UPI0018E7DB01|nr:hypothetical protein [Campylobacter fetus]QQF51776.1 hypothetical protein HHI31_02610 [Campylobacter fetus subsp. venerealis]
MIEQNNQLDSQTWHKFELYAKEIEINYQLEIKENNGKTLKQDNKNIDMKFNEEDYKQINWKNLCKLLKKLPNIIVKCILKVILLISSMVYFILIFVSFMLDIIVFIVHYPCKILISINQFKFIKFKLYWINELNKIKEILNKINKKQKNPNIDILFDLLTLKIYRNTSDHHTNLVKIINLALE